MAQYTEFLGITKLEPGQQQAHVVANEAFDNYDLALAGLIEVDLAGRSEYSMSGRDSTHAVLRFVNADRDCLVTIQARPKTWTVINDCARPVEVRTDYPNSAPLSIGSGLVAKVICDGTAMRAASDGLSQLEAHDRSVSAHNSLTAARTYYIRSGGSDDNDGLTEATALATVNAAKNKIKSLRSNGFAVTLDLGEGQWPAISFTEGNAGDLAALIIKGAGAAKTVIASDGSFAIRMYNINAVVDIKNIGLSASGHGLDILNVKRLNLSDLTFGVCASCHINLQATFCIMGSGVVIAGGAVVFLACTHSSYFRANQLITLTGTPNFSQAFTTCNGASFAYWAGTSFSGGATGVRHQAVNFGGIRVNGGGANFFPGDQAGTANAATGGFYA